MNIAIPSYKIFMTNCIVIIVSIIWIHLYTILILALTIFAYLLVHPVTTQATPPPPPPKKRWCGGGSKFGRTTKGKNNKTAAAVTPGGAASQNRSRTMPNIQPENNQTGTQLQRQCRDLLALKLKYQVQIRDLKDEVKSLTTTVDTHIKDTAKLVKSHNDETTELSTANENRIKAIRDCHATKLRKKAEEVRVLAKKLIADKKASNEVSTWLWLILRFNNWSDALILSAVLLSF